MSLRIGGPRLEGAQAETHEVYSVKENPSKQLEETVDKLGEYILKKCMDPEAIQFLRETLHDVPASYSKIEGLYDAIRKNEKPASRKRHFEHEHQEDRSPSRKKSKNNDSEELSLERKTTTVQSESSLGETILRLDVPEELSKWDGVDFERSWWKPLFDLEGVDKETFNIAAGVKPEDSMSEQVRKSMSFLDKRRGYLPPVIYTEIPTFEDYKKGFEQREKIDYLLFWKQIPGGRNFLSNNSQIESLSNSELKSAFRSFLKKDCSSLNVLEIKGDQFNISPKMLPREIEELSQLETLKINTHLVFLPKEVGKLTKLKVLDLRQNQLSSLPKEIEKLTQLEILVLNDNKLLSLPREIEKLTQLEELYLDENDLSSLPKEIGRLTQLEVLRVWNNKLTFLPEEMEKLTQLRVLDLMDNELVEFPGWINSLEELETACVYGNYFKTPSYMAELAANYFRDF